MISSVGLRTLVENQVDFKQNRNLCLAAVMLVLAIGGAVVGTESFSLSGIGLGIRSKRKYKINQPSDEISEG